MARKKERPRNCSASHGNDSSKAPNIGCASKYTTTARELQAEIDGKFTPKRERAETVAGLYHTLSRRFFEEGPRGGSALDTLDGVPVAVASGTGEAFLQNPIAEFLSIVGETRGMKIVWAKMHRLTGKALLDEVAFLCYRWYAGHGARVDVCGTELEFHVAEEKAALRHANFCRDRMCPMCNWRRSLKIFGQVSRVMEELDKEEYRYLFLTLTVRNVWGDELTGAVQALYDGWRVLYNQYMRGPYRTAEKRLKGVVMGTFRALEVTVSDGEYSPAWAGSFHPHLHVILAVTPDYFKRGHYLEQSEWADIWRAACRLDYAPSVKIEAVRPEELAEFPAVPEEAGSPVSYAGAVAELSKYPLKDADFTHDEEYGQPEGQYLSWLVKALRGRRLIGMTGRFRDIARALNLDDMETGDLVHVEADELREDVNYLVVRYNWRCGAYRSVVFEVGPESAARHRDKTYRLRAEDMTPEAREIRRRQRYPKGRSDLYASPGESAFEREERLEREFRERERRGKERLEKFLREKAEREKADSAKCSNLPDACALPDCAE